MRNIALRRNKEENKQDKVLEEIKLVKIQIQNVCARFEQTSDRDLVESTIYELEALKARYRYLVKSAKSFETF